MFLFYLKNNWKNSYSDNFNFKVRLMIGVRTLCHLMTKFMESSPSKWWSCYKVYIVANKILSQNQSLFLAFWLRKWPFLQLCTKKTRESGKKKRQNKLKIMQKWKNTHQNVRIKIPYQNWAHNLHFAI